MIDYNRSKKWQNTKVEEFNPLKEFINGTIFSIVFTIVIFLFMFGGPVY